MNRRRILSARLAKCLACLALVTSQAAYAGNKDKAQSWCDHYKETHPGESCYIIKRARICPKGTRKETHFGGPARGYKTCIPGKKREVIKQAAKKAGNTMAGATMHGPFLNGYRAFFDRVSAHASPPVQLSNAFIQKYQRHFKNDLRNVRIRESTAVVGRNAMTDCKTVYFPESSGVYENIRDNRPLPRSERWWLLHELTHTEQCKHYGGRNNYALKWFSSIPASTLKAVIKGKSLKKLGQKIHNKMPAEKKANVKADKLVDI
ncbi:MAG: DUF4157 domain-containing protein [Gammaproteobacteria bacterium]|nr:MAG: DUF4157 domain-containing protein [Gammaproteobacteria bacterium]